MRVCFLTLGTRGDVQPYLALSKFLISKGHSAVVCTGKSFKDEIEKEGVDFAEASLDLMEVAISDIGKKVLESPVKNIRLALKLSKEVINPLYRQTMDDFYCAAKGADIIVYHPKALVAVDIAIKLEIPCVSMPPVPITIPTNEFPCLALSSSGNYGHLLNRLTYKVNCKAEAGQIKLINDFRKTTLGFLPRKVGEYMYYRGGESIPTLYPISPYMFQNIKSWEGKVYLSGFFFLDTNEQLSEELDKFINAGCPPITISFSSMPLKNPVLFIKHLKQALDMTNNRAILLVGNSGIDCDTDRNLFVLKQAPHTVLFPKSKAIIHHGGAGTTAAALLAGKPQIIMPHSVDQPFWANQVYKLGCSIAPIVEKDTLPEVLSDFMKQIGDKKMIEKCKTVSDVLKTENGTENAAKYIENLIC